MIIIKEQCVICKGQFLPSQGQKDQNGDFWCHRCFNQQQPPPTNTRSATDCIRCGLPVGANGFWCDACIVELQKQTASIPQPLMCVVCGVIQVFKKGDTCNPCLNQIAAQKAAAVNAARQAQQQARSGRWSSTASPYQKQGGPQVSTSNIKCQIKWDVDVDAYIVSTPYSPQFVEFIKLAIPVSDRAWHPETKVWYIKEKYFSVIRDIALKVYPNQVLVKEKSEVEAQSQKTANAPVAKAKLEFVMTDFVMLLPNDALKAAFRAAATLLHPDKQGGDASKMSRLNELWTRIKQDKAIT